MNTKHTPEEIAAFFAEFYSKIKADDVHKCEDNLIAPSMVHPFHDLSDGQRIRYTILSPHHAGDRMRIHWCYVRSEEANARLIAAAPELLDSLNYIDAVCPDIEPDAEPGDLVELVITSEGLRQLRAAIAKAKGEA